MGRPKYAALKDENHPQVVAWFKEYGCSVIDWNGTIDLVVGFDGITELVEIKNPDRPGKLNKQLTQSQKDMLENWKGSPIQFVYSKADVAYVVGVMKMRALYQDKK